MTSQRRFLAVLGTCLAFDVFLQSGAWLTQVGRDWGTSEWLRFAAAFPFLQLEHLVVAAAIAAPCLASARPPVRALVFVLAVATSFALVVDRAVYAEFFDHLNPSLADTTASEVLRRWRDHPETILDALTPGSTTNLLLFAAVVVALARILSLPPLPSTGPGPRFGRPAIAASFAAYAGLCFAVDGRIETRGLEQHVALAWLRSDAEPAFVPSGRLSPVTGQGLVAGAFSEAPDVARRLTAFADETRGRRPRPNVVLVVLESVGAEQLLEDGRPRTDVAPFLAGLAARGVVLDSLYSVFPATTRAHLALMTGGRHTTWGQLSDELSHRYTGPTLVGELKKHGYRTGAFAAQDLRFEAMDAFYEHLGFDRLSHPGDRRSALTREPLLNEWSIAEEPVRREALAWLDERHGEPFFLAFLTSTTHYPYDTPPGFRGPREGDDRLSRYENALRYGDGVLEDLHADLERRGLLEDTLWVVTGDHGQAFGDRHAENFTHKNHLYEENVRTFAILSGHSDGPVAAAGPLVSHRIGAISDIAPTLLSMLGIPTAMPGVDLLAPGWEPPLVFFHKGARPAAFGLRDGQWKFIVDQNGDDPRLFDLGVDPLEQANLAASAPDQVAAYQRLCHRWYANASYDFAAHLEGYRLPGGDGFDEHELATPGPKILAVGYEDEGEFVEADPVPIDRLPVAWARWTPYREETLVVHVLVSPSGRRHWFRFAVAGGWVKTQVPLDVPFDREPGTWELSMWDGSGRLLETRFRVGGDG